jgi:molybdopterin-guanine dinucleotide biosynthesis protein A
MTSELARHVSAVVLAGGRSSRFGASKLEAELDGTSVLEHAIRAVAAVAADIVVALPAAGSSSEPTVGEIPGEAVVRFVRDPEEYGGPLVGLEAALAAASGRLAIVVGGDMPRLQAAVLGAMLDGLEPQTSYGEGRLIEAVVLTSDGLRRALPIALRVDAARSAIAATLGRGERSLRSMLAGLAVAELDPEIWRTLDPDGETLIDIDEPADLEALGPIEPV